MPSVPFRPLPVDLDDVRYEPGPDSVLRPGVTAGRTVEVTLADRTVWVHVPAGVGTGPLPCTVFQDGGGFLDPDDGLRAGTVLDNLVAAGDVPPVVGVFVDPGPDRNAEYDTFDGRYAARLVDEVLPRVAQEVALSEDPRDRALVGFSSGGSASLIAAWRGTVRTPSGASRRSRRACRRCAAATRSPDSSPPSRRGRCGCCCRSATATSAWDEPDSWVVDNLRLAADLLEAGYDTRLVLGDGGHEPSHAAALLPDVLSWLWRD